MNIQDEIKSRLPIEDLVKDYVVLKPSGKNYKGLSPFKQEKTPSFIVSPDKGLAYCFATQQGGDIFQFFMLMEKVDFKEALHVLAERVGVVIDHDRHTPKQQQALSGDLQTYIEAMPGSEAFEYVKSRGYTSSTIQAFSLGYAPVTRSKDVFKGRLIFPLFNHLGKVVGFAGRSLHDKQEPKYINSKESDVYSKSRFLYGLNLAKEAIRSLGFVLIVEGYFDVIAAHDLGMNNTVAICGTALTKEHIQLLKRYTSRCVLCFDADEAGKMATKRSLPLLLEAGMDIRMLTLPTKDIDELRVQGGNMAEMITKATHPLHVFLEDVTSPNDPLVQKTFLDEWIPLIQKAHISYIDSYLKKIAQYFSLPIHSLYFLLGQQELPILNNEIQQENPKKMSLEEYVLALMCAYPEKRDMFEDIMKFLDPSMQDVYKSILGSYNDERNLKRDAYALYVESFHDSLSDVEKQKDIIDSVLRLKRQWVSRKKSEIIASMNTASPDTYEKLAQDLMDISSII